MFKYALKRIAVAIPTFFVVLVLVFALLRMVPGSPIYYMYPGEELSPQEVEELEEYHGLNDPVVVQFVRYLKDVFTGNWGNSYITGTPVFENILRVWEPCIVISVLATLITVLIGVPVGVISALKRNSALDYFVSTLSTASSTVPTVCWALLLLYFFAYKLELFPLYQPYPKLGNNFWLTIWVVALPAISLGTHHIASLARITRATMLDVINQDYVRTAKAKGLPARKVHYKHALKNTLSLVGTNIIGSFMGMVGGSAVTERVFGIRGLGTLATETMAGRDYSQEQAIVILTAVLGLTMNLIMDIFYKWLDPRIEYE